MKAERTTTMSGNGAPPAAAGTLYIGPVMHQRMKPFGHRFSYDVFSLVVDIDRLEDLARQTPLLAVNRPGVVSFRADDHVATGTLREHADRLLADAGVTEPANRILLMCYPRMLGYVFNPISVWFCFGADDGLIAVIYAVRNTFGQSHTYVAPVEPGDMDDSGVRQTRAKLFHVSPFIGMEARYNFRVMPPGKVVRLRIHETENGEPLLAASFAGSAEKLGTAALLRSLLKIPFLTWKIMVGIHWEAMKLWFKGARFHGSPPAPAPASYRDSQSAPVPGE